jgi:hypothetical protein
MFCLVFHYQSPVPVIISNIACATRLGRKEPHFWTPFLASVQDGDNISGDIERIF